MQSLEFHKDNVPGFLQASLKIGWAKRHLDTLYSYIMEFQGSKPYSLFAEDDLERGQHIIRVEIGALPVEMGLIVGDFASCLRASLDHLAGFLTMAAGGTHNDRASFPVVGEWNKDGESLFNKSVRGITPAAIKVIDSMQPYHSGSAYKSTKLWRLHRLWNIDKHRRIPLHATVAEIEIGHPSNMTPIVGGADDNNEVRFPLAAKGHLHLKPSVKIGIEFGDITEGIVIRAEELIEIHEFIGTDVFPRFECFF